MRLHRILTLSLALCLAGAGAAAASRRPAAKQSASKRTAASTKKTASKAKKAGPSARARKRLAGPPRQLAPTPERYKEVQQALADSGYYTGPIDGNWDSECVAALKRFQEAQNIAVDGKLGALSLIALGLGPKREPLQTQFLAKPDETEPAQ